MTAPVDRLAAIIAEQMRADGWTCEYHEPTSREGECSGCDESLTRTARAAAAVIAGDEDLAVIELPKPNDDAEYGKVWRYDDVLGTVQVRPDGTIESRGDYEYEHTLAEMRAAAGVAAAAAKAAEGVSDR